MILLLGGTSDARLLADVLSTAGYEILVSTATAHGAALAGSQVGEVVWGRMDAEEMAQFMQERNIQAVVDASHPFAETLSQNAKLATKTCHIGYIRYARARQALPEYPLLYPVNTYEEAADKALRLAHTIFLTTGSKTASIFVQAARGQAKRLIFRILPDPEGIHHLLQQGVAIGDIVAMQGPFACDLNISLLKHFAAEVLVTKESGDAGGQEDKIEAARMLQIPVVMIQRPSEPEDAVSNPEALLKALKNLMA